jgi:Right handed beta helix region
MNQKRIRAILSSIAAICILVPSYVWAANIIWTGNVSTAWNTVGNWWNSDIGAPAAALPGVDDDVTIMSDAGFWPYHSIGTSTINSLNIQSGASLDVTGGTLNTTSASTSNTGTLNISGGTINFNAAAGFDTFTQTGGALGGTGEVTVNDTFTWSAGNMTGTGATTLGSGCTGSIDTGTDFKILDAHTINNNGSLAYTVPAAGWYMRSQYGAVINNLSGGTFDIQNDGIVIDYITAGAVGTFNNSGTLIKSAGTGTSTIEMVFNNSATGLDEVDVQNGTLSVNQGGASTGNFAISSGTFAFAGGDHTIEAGASMTGAGSTTVSGGTVAVNCPYELTGTLSITGGTTTFNNTANTGTGILAISGGGTGNFNDDASFDILTQTGGMLGGTGEVTINSSFTWSAGSMTGTGATTLGSGCTGSIDTGTDFKILDAHTINNNGSLAYTVPSDGWYMRSQYGAVINNLSGGTFDIQNDGIVIDYITAGAVGIFNNSGTLIKSVGAGTSTIEMTFNNTTDGAEAVDVQSGTLSVNQGGTSTGNFAISSGTFDFAGGYHTITAGASMTGGGSMTVSGGIVDVNCAYEMTGTLTITSGTTTFYDTANTGTGTLAISGNGIGSFNAAASFDTLTQTGGTLGGTGEVTVNDTFTWSGGNMTGTGATTLGPICTGSIDTGTDFKILDAHTINNNGRLNYTVPAAGWYMRSQYGAVINNLSGGIFDIQGDGIVIDLITGDVGTFNNSGTLLKSAGTGISTIEMAVDNPGSIDVRSGTFNFPQTLTNQASGIILGYGTLDVSTASSFTNEGTINPGTSPGTLTITGDLPQEATSVINIEIGGLVAGTEYDRLDVSGTATLAGTLNVILINGFNPVDGDSFTILPYASQGGGFNTTNLPALSGSLNWIVTSGGSSIILDVVDAATDTDQDGLTDLDEINIHGTDPNNPDSDNDGYYDGEEIAYDTDANSDLDFPVFSPGNYYVDVTAATYGDGSSEYPWRILHHAIDVVNGGSPGAFILQVDTGIYTLVSNGGHEPDETLILTQDNVSIQGMTGAVLEGTTLDNFVWENAIEINAGNVTVAGLEIRNFYSDIWYGILVTSGDTITIDNCTIDNGNYAIGIQSGATNVSVTHCIISNHDRGGIDVQDSAPLIAYNRFYDNVFAVYIRASGNGTSLIFNNLVNNTLFWTDYGIVVNADRVEISHNTLNGGQRDGIYINGESPNLSIWFNSISNFALYGIRDDGATPSNPILGYNNVYSPDGSGNYWNVTAGADDISADPLYVDAASGDFHLSPASPCVDAIPYLTGYAFADDLEGNTRPQGSRFDMGCYETQGSAGDVDSDGDGVPDGQDGCPMDPDKTDPGQCGCGVTDTDGDSDGLADCVDVYPGNAGNRPSQVLPADGLIIPAGVNVTLTSTGFQPAGGVTHDLTHWQVWRTDNGEMISGIPDTDLTETVLGSGLFSEGLQYTWRVGYEDSETQVSWSLEQTFIIGTSETDETVQVTSGTDVAAYKMVSFVQWPDDPRAEVVFGDEMASDYDGNYRIGTYNADRGAYDEYGTGRLMVVPGRGYWFLAREGLDTIVDGVPVSLSAQVYIALDYNSVTLDGWNMVGPPNGADYLWGDVEVVEDVAGTLTPRGTVQSLLEDNPYIDRRLWRWEGGAYASDTPDTDPTLVMTAYEGYWVKAKQANVYLRFDPGVQQTAALDQSDTLLARTWHKASTLLSVLNFFSQEAVADNDTPPMPMGGLDDNTVDPVFQGCFIEIVDDFNSF